MELCHKLRRLLTHAAIASLLTFSLSFPATTLAEAFDENGLLLLDLTLDREILGQSVTAYTSRGIVYVSLAETAAALEFPIEVDANNNSAKGWFLSQERRFELNLKTKTVTIADETQTLSSTDALVHEQDIFVPLSAFSHWFPVDLAFEMISLSIKVSPREPLPTQLRASRRQLVGKRFVMTPPELPNVTPSYTLIGPPVADISLGYSVRRDTDPEITDPDTNWSHSTLIRNDLAYMSSSIYLSGGKHESIQNARMTLSREEPFTPAGIDKIEVGDIIPAWLQGAPQHGFERGILVQGSTKKDSELYSLDGNKTHISGDIHQDWEVELLHNGIRIDYQLIGPNGRYDFREIDLYSDTNTFELIFYGPAGERRSEIITRYGAANAIREGNISYQFSASQLGKPLHEDSIDPAIPDTDLGSGRYTTDLVYDISSGLSVNSGWNSVVTDGDRLNYYGAGLQTRWRVISLGLKGIKDPLGGTIWNAVINTPLTAELWGFNTKIQYTQYANSVVGTDPETEEKLSSHTNITVSGKIAAVASRFVVNHNEQENSSSTNYGADLSMKAGSTRFGNALYRQTYDDPNTPNKPSKSTGSLYFDSMLLPLYIRGTYNYQLQPEHKPLQYELTTDVSVAADMSMNFSLKYTPDNKLSTYTAGLSWHLKHIRLTPRISHNSDGTYMGFISASFSLSPRHERKGLLMSSKSTAQFGTVASRVFTDIDGDGVFSDGDPPIPNAIVYAPQQRRHIETDEQGMAYLTGLQSKRASDIRLDQETLPDTKMISQHKGNSVQPRPGHRDIIDFPITIGGEIDGTLLQRNADNTLTPRSGLVVELRDINNELVDFKISGQGGFFLFDFVPYGQYSLTLTEDNRDKLTHSAPTVVLSETTPDQSGLELVVNIPDTRATHSFIPQAATKTSIIPTPAAFEAPAAAPSLPPASTPSPSITLQLGAFSNQVKANAAIQLFKQRYGSDTLKGLNLHVEQINLGARGTFYRVQASGPEDGKLASSRCQQLNTLGQSCIVVTQKNNN